MPPINAKLSAPRCRHRVKSEYHCRAKPRIDHQICKDEVNTLFKHVACGAIHNSKERFDPPKCHPRTREAVRKAIQDWAINPLCPRPVMWIYGPAGSGKSAIMQTIAEQYEQDGILGASFFFCRTALGQNVCTHFITTLAYQLASEIPSFKICLCEAIANDPSIFTRNLHSQMKALIVNPMAAAVRVDPNWRKWKFLILVDGLDECAPETSQREIIKTLCNTASPTFRVLIASRREYLIHNMFSLAEVRCRTQTLALDDRYEPDADIRTFLEDEFLKISASHPSNHFFPCVWPSEDEIDRLVQTASGQFVYAKTVMNLLTDSRQVSPVARLASILEVKEQSDRPFAQLDALYHQILSSVPDLYLPKVLAILHFAIYLPNLSFPRTIETILGYPPGEIHCILSDLHSLLDIPDANSAEEMSQERCIKFHHASLGDFLSDPLRSEHLYIPPAEVCASLAVCMIRQYDNLLSEKELFIFIHNFPVLLQQSCMTQELAETLSAFNIYRGIVISDFVADEDYGTTEDSFGYLVCLDRFYMWLRGQEPSPMATKLCSFAVECLDRWLASLLESTEMGPNNWITPLLHASRVSKAKTVELIKYLSPSPLRCSDSEIGLVSALVDISSNSNCMTYQQLQRLEPPGTYNPVSALLKFCLRYHLPWRALVDNWLYLGTNFSQLVKHLLEILVRAEANPEFGHLLEGLQTHAEDGYSDLSIVRPYYLGCKIDEDDGQCFHSHCRHVAVVLLKRDLRDLAIVALTYLKKCGIELGTHDYNSKHFICFLCQCSGVFLSDPEFGADFKFYFDEK